MDLLEIDIALARRSFDLRAALNLGAETIALVGPSGAGKTSLLRAIAGLERPFAGRIALGGDVWLDTERNIHLSPERRRLGYLPQDYALFPHLTVAGNVRFAGKRDRPDLLERLGIVHLARARPQQLSGGERQRAALARALARDPRVLLLDEPFGALDAITRRHVRDELGDLLTQLELPTLLVTHAFEDATVLAQRVGVIDDGRLVQLAPPTELLTAPANVKVAALTGANIVQGIATRAGSGATIRIHGGGVLASATPANGSVDIAVYPWDLALADPEDASFTDTVLNVRQDRGALVIRLTRLTLTTALGANGAAPVDEGAVVGLRAASHDVHLFPAGS